MGMQTMVPKQVSYGQWSLSPKISRNYKRIRRRRTIDRATSRFLTDLGIGLVGALSILAFIRYGLAFLMAIGPLIPSL